MYISVDMHEPRCKVDDLPHGSACHEWLQSAFGKQTGVFNFPGQSYYRLLELVLVLNDALSDRKILLSQ